MSEGAKDNGNWHLGAYSDNESRLSNSDEKRMLNNQNRWSFDKTLEQEQLPKETDLGNMSP